MGPAYAPRPSFTISIVFVRGMLSALRLRGDDPLPWLERAGIAPGLLHEPAARVTAEQYSALFRALIEGLDDEGLGFFSRPLRRGSQALVMRSVLGARSVGTALRRLVSGFNLLQDDVGFSLATQGTQAAIRIDVPARYLPDRPFMHEMLLRVLFSQLNWLVGARLKHLAFELAMPRPGHAHEFAKLFPGTLRFERPCTALVFDAAVLVQPFLHDAASLRLFLERMPQGIIVPERKLPGVSERVRRCLLQGRPQWRTLEEAAATLHLAVSTLQRHLAREGTSFQRLKDELRRDLAIQHLHASSTALTALALELGFSDSATFQRAFKTWTGSPPGAYRLRFGPGVRRS